ncbi:MAG: hypothetical protein HQL17_03350 [Candidatus Omnitrophica bacterium]|nr:hypothetical protein [Candidatus Omnitrophota bacterium]
MKLFIILSGLSLAAVIIIAGMRLEASVRSREVQAGVIKRDIARKQGELEALEGLSSIQGVSLGQAYMDVFNDLGVLARVHRSSCSVKVDGASSPDVLSAAHDAVWPGLRELKVQAVFSGFRSHAALVAFLEAVDSFQHTRPVLIKCVLYQKSNVVIDLIVMGVGV